MLMRFPGGVYEGGNGRQEPPRAISHQRRYEIDARDVVHVVDFYVAMYPLVATRFYARFEYVSVVEMLHRLSAQVDAQVFQLTGLKKKKM